MIKRTFQLMIVLMIALSMPGLVPQKVPVAAAQVYTVGYYTHADGQGQPWQATPITVAGHMPMLVSNLDAGTLAGLDILVVDGNRSGPTAEWTSNLAAIDAAIANGLVLVYTDWEPQTAAASVPGAQGIVWCRNCGDHKDINVVNAQSLVVNGPGGMITNTNLDGGNSSHHGEADLATLPPGADNILSAGLASQSVLFSYPYGAGYVVYASIPMSHYLDDRGPEPPRNAMKNILAPNMIAYAASLAGGGGQPPIAGGQPPVVAGGALKVGYYSHDAGQGEDWQTASITAAGHMPVNVTVPDAATLAGLDIFYVDGGPGIEWESNLAAIDAAVRNGLVLIYADRTPDEAANLVPGATNVNWCSMCGNQQDVNVVNAASLVVNGPAGVISNTTLDGGNQSHHGYADLNTLPAGADNILSAEMASQSVLFSYPLGSGHVIYTSIPLDWYLRGMGIDPPATAMRNVLAPNMVAYGASLAGGGGGGQPPVIPGGSLQVGYYAHDSGQGQPWQVPPITAAGHTPVLVTTPDAATLAGLDILVVDGEWATPSPEWTANLAAIDAAVSKGLVLVYTDWNPATATANLPGAAGIAFCDRCGDREDINVVNAMSTVTNGPFGVINNFNLDGGSLSHHGTVNAMTLPAGADNILSSTTANESVLFSYPYGTGHVIYSTIPLGCYLTDTCVDPPRTTINTILAPNMIAYAAELAGGGDGGDGGDGGQGGSLQVGYYAHDSGQGQPWQVPPITAAGHTPVLVTTPDVVTLARLDILVVDGEWATPSPEWTANFAAIDAAVQNGLVLVYTDWNPATATANLPGAAGIAFCDRCGDREDINVVNAMSTVTNGPFGVINNFNLDGGSLSHHGTVNAMTLPAGADNILSSTTANESVLFSYPYGAGYVIYSTIPLGCYLTDTCVDPPRTTINTILAPNMIAYAAELAGGGGGGGAAPPEGSG